jgi:hypothetical protein
VSNIDKVKTEIKQLLTEVSNYGGCDALSPTHNLESYLVAKTKELLSNPLILIKADNQELPGWQYYDWHSSRLDKNMNRYCAGTIDKPEKERQFRKIHDEELVIYKKAQQDMLKTNFVKVEDK